MMAILNSKEACASFIGPHYYILFAIDPNTGMISEFQPGREDFDESQRYSISDP